VIGIETVTAIVTVIWNENVNESENAKNETEIVIVIARTLLAKQHAPAHEIEAVSGTAAPSVIVSVIVPMVSTQSAMASLTQALAVVQVAHVTRTVPLPRTRRKTKTRIRTRTARRPRAAVTPRRQKRPVRRNREAIGAAPARTRAAAKTRLLMPQRVRMMTARSLWRRPCRKMVMAMVHKKRKPPLRVIALDHHLNERPNNVCLH